MPDRDVTVVILAFGPEPHLQACIDSVLRSQGVRVTVVVVDNGCPNPVLTAYGRDDQVRLVSPGRNLGYAAGCNTGACATNDQMLLFLNSDCIVTEHAVAALTEAATCEGVGLVTASVRLADKPDVWNSAGNPVHFLGFSWAGRSGERVVLPEQRGRVASVSGACFALHRTVWEELGGFTAEYFAYHEDVDLSLRCWLTGRTVLYVPAAVALHHYEFSRNPRKMYLLERNRLITWLTVLEPRTLALLAPALIAAELALAALALRQGWLVQKLAGWLWLLRHARWLAARRRLVGRSRTCPDRVLTNVLNGGLDPAGEIMPAALVAATAPLRSYWWVVRRCL